MIEYEVNNKVMKKIVSKFKVDLPGLELKAERELFHFCNSLFLGKAGNSLKQLLLNIHTILIGKFNQNLCSLPAFEAEGSSIILLLH